MARDRKRTPSPPSPKRHSKGKKKINYLSAGATALSFYSIFKSLTGILFGVIMLRKRFAFHSFRSNSVVLLKLRFYTLG